MRFVFPVLAGLAAIALVAAAMPSQRTPSPKQPASAPAGM
jgi:hypothetical protein